MCAASTVYGDKKYFAPRFGFAYAVGPHSRTAIRGRFGIFFDTPTGQVTQQKLFEPPYSANQTSLFGPASTLSGFTLPAPIDVSNPPPKIVPGGSLAIWPIATKSWAPERWYRGGNRNLIRVALAWDQSQALPLWGTYFGAASSFLGMGCHGVRVPKRTLKSVLLAGEGRALLDMTRVGRQTHVRQP